MTVICVKLAGATLAHAANKQRDHIGAVLTTRGLQPGVQSAQLGQARHHPVERILYLASEHDVAV